MVERASLFRFPMMAAAAMVLSGPIVAPWQAAQAQAYPAPIEFSIYFGSGMATLTPEAEMVLDDAVARIKRLAKAGPGSAQRILLTGNTDTKAADGASLAMSVRMVESVRAALIARGVPPALITGAAMGESAPGRPVRDGVSDPLLRRVDITVDFNR